MSLYKQFKTEAELEKKGVLVEIGVGSNGQPIRFLIARAGGANDAFFRASERISKPFRRQLQAETISRENVTKINQEVYAETVVLGWENMTDENDNPMEHSKANVLKVFKDLPDVWSDVFESAQKAAYYRADVREGDSKN